jgi:hypothetical protein
VPIVITTDSAIAPAGVLEILECAGLAHRFLVPAGIPGIVYAVADEQTVPVGIVTAAPGK